MPRAMQQMWDERQQFLKFERGWDHEEADIETLKLDDADETSPDGIANDGVQNTQASDELEDVEPRIRSKLQLIETIYVRDYPLPTVSYR